MMATMSIHEPVDCRRGRLIIATLINFAFGIAAVSWYSTTIIIHGPPPTSSVEDITPGLTQEQVKLTLGTLDTTANAVTGSAYYYVQSAMLQKDGLRIEVDPEVIAVYFTRAGTVHGVAIYRMQDGKMFVLSGHAKPSMAK
jgi:outer membrane protein assembly factor BamE (lipoprotein component of BamABCDE complex)